MGRSAGPIRGLGIFVEFPLVVVELLVDDSVEEPVKVVRAVEHDLVEELTGFHVEFAMAARSSSTVIVPVLRMRSATHLNTWSVSSCVWLTRR